MIMLCIIHNDFSQYMKLRKKRFTVVSLWKSKKSMGHRRTCKLCIMAAVISLKCQFWHPYLDLRESIHGQRQKCGKSYLNNVGYVQCDTDHQWPASGPLQAHYQQIDMYT